MALEFIGYSAFVSNLDYILCSRIYLAPLLFFVIFDISLLSIKIFLNLIFYPH